MRDFFRWFVLICLTMIQIRLIRIVSVELRLRFLIHLLSKAKAKGNKIHEDSEFCIWEYKIFGLAVKIIEKKE